MSNQINIALPEGLSHPTFTLFETVAYKSDSAFYEIGTVVGIEWGTDIPMWLYTVHFGNRIDSLGFSTEPGLSEYELEPYQEIKPHCISRTTFN